jgi:hypothetical protein
MNEEQDKSMPDATGIDPVAIDNIEDVLLEFDKEPEIGSSGVSDTPVDIAPITEEVSVEPTPSPFGPPLANFGSTQNQGQSNPSVSGAQPRPPQALSSNTASPAPTPQKPTVIQDVRPPVSQPNSAESVPPTPVKDSIAEMVAAPKPASPASSAIESLISARDRVEIKDGTKSRKDIKLPTIKKSKKGLVWVLSSVMLLLIATVVGWFFMVKSPADQAAIDYKANAVTYLESVNSAMDQSSDDLNSTLGSLNAVSRPSLEVTLLSSFSYSDSYKDAESLQRNVNAEATKVIDGVKSMVEANKLITINDESESEGSSILDQITEASTDEEKNSTYKEYIKHLESLKASINGLGTMPEAIDSRMANLITAIDTEITAYSSTIVSDAETEGGTEASLDDSVDSEVDDPAAGGVDDGADTQQTEEESGTGSVDVSEATQNRQAIAVLISDYLIANSQSIFDNLKNNLNSFISTIK